MKTTSSLIISLDSNNERNLNRTYRTLLFKSNLIRVVAHLFRKFMEKKVSSSPPSNVQGVGDQASEKDYMQSVRTDTKIAGNVSSL